MITLRFGATCKSQSSMKKNTESIVLGGGCFWCLDAGFRLINGVVDVTSGFAGGHTLNPSYYEVVNGTTGHAEVVKVDFDNSIIVLKDILNIFWAMHDPTTLNRQGHDIGPQYRSIILYYDISQKSVVEKSISETTKLWDNPIVTQIAKLDIFYPADDEHQNFFNKHPEMAYCQVVINPKLAKLRTAYTSHLKI